MEELILHFVAALFCHKPWAFQGIASYLDCAWHSSKVRASPVLCQCTTVTHEQQAITSTATPRRLSYRVTQPLRYVRNIELLLDPTGASLGAPVTVPGRSYRMRRSDAIPLKYACTCKAHTQLFDKAAC